MRSHDQLTMFEWHNKFDNIFHNYHQYNRSYRNEFGVLLFLCMNINKNSIMKTFFFKSFRNLTSKMCQVHLSLAFFLYTWTNPNKISHQTYYFFGKWFLINGHRQHRFESHECLPSLLMTICFIQPNKISRFNYMELLNLDKTANNNLLINILIS